MRGGGFFVLLFLVLEVLGELLTKRAKCFASSLVLAAVKSEKRNKEIIREIDLQEDRQWKFRRGLNSAHRWPPIGAYMGLRLCSSCRVSRSEGHHAPSSRKGGAEGSGGSPTSVDLPLGAFLVRHLRASVTLVLVFSPSALLHHHHRPDSQQANSIRSDTITITTLQAACT